MLAHSPEPQLECQAGSWCLEEYFQVCPQIGCLCRHSSEVQERARTIEMTIRDSRGSPNLLASSIAEGRSDPKAPMEWRVESIRADVPKPAYRPSNNRSHPALRSL